MKAKPWSREEDRILKLYFPTEGTGVVERLPGRTKVAIQQRAGDYGIRMDPAAKRGRSRRPKKESQQANVRAATPPPRNLDEARARGQVSDLYGRTAGTKESLTPVPESALGLPWVSRPRDAQGLNDCAEILEQCAHGEKREAVKKYLITEANCLRALAKRIEAQPAAA